MNTTSQYNQRLGTLLVLSAGIAFSTLTIWAVKLNEYGVSAWLQVITRSVGATLIFSAIHLSMTYSSAPAKITRRRNLLLFLNGFMVVGASLSYLGAIALGTPPTKAVLLAFLYPIYTMILAALFLGEPITVRKGFALILGVIGIGLTLEIWAIGNLSHLKTGDLVALSNGFMSACMVIIGRYTGARPSQSVWQTLSRTYFYTLVWLGILAAAVVLFDGFKEISRALDFTPDLPTVLYMVGLAIFGTATPYLLLYLGLRRMSSGSAGVLLLIEPVGVFLLTGLLLNQEIGVWQFIGGAAILTAGAIAVYDPPPDGKPRAFTRRLFGGFAP